MCRIGSVKVSSSGPVSATSSSQYSVITPRPLNDASARLKSIDRYLYTSNIVYKFIIVCVKISRMFKKEWVHKKRNLSLNMKFGQFIKSVGILQFQTVIRFIFMYWLCCRTELLTSKKIQLSLTSSCFFLRYMI